MLTSLVSFGQVQNTPNIGLQLPPFGSTQWNVPLNYNFTQLDLMLSGNVTLPGISISGYANMPGLTTWTKTTSYSTGSVVFYQGVAYASLVNGNLNNTPANGSFWTNAIGVGGVVPCGTSGQVQFNSSGVLGCDATFTFTSSVHTLGTLNLNLQAQGVASIGNNEPSGTLSLEADVCTNSSPCTPVPIFYQQQVFVGGGANPYTLWDHSCITTNSSTCQEDFDYPIFATAGSITAVADAQTFGAKGDAYKPPNGCSTTASSTTVTCPDGPFVSTDVGKQVWVSGAGAGGAAFNATITVFTGNTTVTVSAAATGTVTNGPAVYGHDDTQQVQACFQYSAVNAIQCVLKAKPSIGQGLTGFLIGSAGLKLVSNNPLNESSATNVTGAGQLGATNLFCEFNGDCLSLASGPIQGSNVSNLSFNEDPTQPASRGIHLNPSAGTFGPGPFTSGNFTNVSVETPALECLWLDGGGGPGYDFTLPNQYVTFNQFWCNGPNQSHTANLIKATGQAAQILFLNGQVNGQGWTFSGSGGSTSASAFYPNPLVSITEKTSTLGDTPVDVKFFGFTIEVGTQGLYVGNGSNNIHFDNGYIEAISSPLIAINSGSLTFNGVHNANSGNIGGVAQYTGGVTGSMRDLYAYGAVIPAAMAACSGSGNGIDFADNNSTNTTTTCGYSVAVSSGTQGANSCSSPTTQTITGLTTQSVITPGYASNPTGVVGWGSTGGMTFKVWPSAANTAQWSICNATGSPITYGALTFNEVFK
jgi:hypothetical protein